MRIKYEIAQNGYRSAIQEARENNAFDQWVSDKFGSRIRALISDDFAMTIEDNGFVVDFWVEDDGREFLKHFGGRTIE
ncbi:hypothetical protein [Ensifer canadensis]